MVVHPGPSLLEKWPHESPFSVLDCALLIFLVILESGHPKAKLHGLSSHSEWLSHSSKWREWDIETMNTAQDDVISAFCATTDINPRFADVFCLFLKDASSIVARCCGVYLHFEDSIPICSDAAHSITYVASKFLDNILLAVCLLNSMSNCKELCDTVRQLNNSNRDLEFAPDPSCPPVVLVKVEPCDSETDCDIRVPVHITTSAHLEYELVAIIWEGQNWDYHADVMVNQRFWRYSETSGGNSEVNYNHVLVDNETHLRVKQKTPDSTQLSTLVYAHSYGSDITRKPSKTLGSWVVVIMSGLLMRKGLEWHNSIFD